MALTSSDGLPLGSPAPPFELPGTDDRAHGLDDFRDARALLVVFTCNHCPYAIAAEDRLIELANTYRDKGLAVVAINPNDAVRYPDDSFENMKVRATEKAFPFPYLFDESQGVAKAYQAVCTPDPFLFDGDRRLVYNGRIDDDWQHPERVTQRDLAAAIEATLDGAPVAGDIVPSRGCSIKWRW